MPYSRGSAARNASTFTLPELKFPTTSLTKGTNIPPPPPEPVIPASTNKYAQPDPETLKRLQGISEEKELASSMPGAFPQTPPRTPTKPRLNDSQSSSPIKSPRTRRDSIRRFFSFGSSSRVNSTDNLPSVTSNGDSMNPASPTKAKGGNMPYMERPGTSRNRTSSLLGWSRRLSSLNLGQMPEDPATRVDSRQSAAAQARAAPYRTYSRPRDPPPTLPSLEKLGGNMKNDFGGFLDTNMFRGITA